jgi:hypothetical protein
MATIQEKRARAGTPGYDKYGEKTGGAGSLKQKKQTNSDFENYKTRKAREGKGNRKGNVNSGNQTLEQRGLGKSEKPVYRGTTAEERNASMEKIKNYKTKDKNTTTRTLTNQKGNTNNTTPRKKVNTAQSRKKVGSANAGIKSSGTTTKDFAQREKDSRTITGGILTNKAGVSGKTTVGEIRSNRENQNRTDGGKLNSYKQGDKRSTYDAISKEELANMTPQQRRIAKRTSKRLDRKEGRKNDRARNVAIRRGLSPQQAKDFMQNRRNRLNQAMGEFGKGLMGKQQNLGNIEDRMYRKKGTGTLQNMKAEDGSTYDATAPYQGVGPNRTGRGLARTYYDKITKAKPLDLKPTIPLSIESQNDTENQNKTTKVIENNLEGNQGNNLSTKLYSDMPAAQRAAARAYNIDKYGTNSPTAEGKADNTFTYKDGERAQGLEKYNESLRKASGVSPTNKLDDRSTMQGNMMNAKGRR